MSAPKSTGVRPPQRGEQAERNDAERHEQELSLCEDIAPQGSAQTHKELPAARPPFLRHMARRKGAEPRRIAREEIGGQQGRQPEEQQLRHPAEHARDAAEHALRHGVGHDTSARKQPVDPLGCSLSHPVRQAAGQVQGRGMQALQRLGQRGEQAGQTGAQGQRSPATAPSRGP